MGVYVRIIAPMHQISLISGISLFDTKKNKRKPGNASSLCRPHKRWDLAKDGGQREMTLPPTCTIANRPHYANLKHSGMK
jgi:hypothetical protein